MFVHLRQKGMSNSRSDWSAKSSKHDSQHADQTDLPLISMRSRKADQTDLPTITTLQHIFLLNSKKWTWVTNNGWFDQHSTQILCLLITTHEELENQSIKSLQTHMRHNGDSAAPTKKPQKAVVSFNPPQIFTAAQHPVRLSMNILGRSVWSARDVQRGLRTQWELQQLSGSSLRRKVSLNLKHDHLDVMLSQLSFVGGWIIQVEPPVDNVTKIDPFSSFLESGVVSLCSAIFPSLVFNPCRSKPCSCAGFCLVPPDETFARGLVAFEQLSNPNGPGALAIDLRLFTRHESTHVFYLCLINWIGTIHRILRMQLCCCAPDTNMIMSLDMSLPLRQLGSGDGQYVLWPISLQSSVALIVRICHQCCHQKICFCGSCPWLVGEIENIVPGSLVSCWLNNRRKKISNTQYLPLHVLPLQRNLSNMLTQILHYRLGICTAWWYRFSIDQLRDWKKARWDNRWRNKNKWLFIG